MQSLPLLRRTALVALSLMLLAGCGGSSSTPVPAPAPSPAPASPAVPAPAPTPTMEKELTVGYWGGPIGDAVKKAFVDSFATKYGVKVNVVQELDNARFTKLQAQKDNPPLDVALFTDPVMPSVLAAGIVAPYDPAQVPLAKDLYSFLTDPTHQRVTFAFGTWGIAYNKAKVGREINSWRDLMDPAFKGHVSHPDITYNSSVLSLVALARLDGGDLNNLDPGFKNMIKVRQNADSFWANSNLLIDWMKQGTVWISPYASGGTLDMARDNKDIAFVNPKEGAYLVPFHMVMVKNTKSPVAAQAFMNNALDPVNQKIFAQAMFYSPGNQKTQLDDAYKSLVLSANDLSQIKSIDWNAFEKQKQAITDRWLREVR